MYKINKTQRILQMSCQFLYFFYNTGPNLAQILLLCVTAVLGGNNQLGTKNRNFSRLYNFIFRTGLQLKLSTLIESPQHISLQISKKQQQQQKNKQTSKQKQKTVKQNKTKKTKSVWSLTAVIEIAARNTTCILQRNCPFWVTNRSQSFDLQSF